MHTVKEVKNYIRTYGWIEFLKIPLRPTFFKIFDFKRVQLQYVSLENLPYREPGEEINVKKADYEDLYRLKDISTNIEHFQKLLESGNHILIALHGDKVIGRLCVNFQLHKPWEKVLKLEPDEAWGENAFVLPEYRGKGIYSAMYSMATQMLKEQGFKRMFVIISFRNHKSMKIHRKLGGKEIGWITYIKFLGFEKIWFKGDRVWSVGY